METFRPEVYSTYKKITFIHFRLLLNEYGAVGNANIRTTHISRCVYLMTKPAGHRGSKLNVSKNTQSKHYD